MTADSAGFESYFRGSWWDVQIHTERSSMFLVSYNADRDEDKAWVPLTELRLSSRRGDGWDCHLLKKGMDVSVLSKHPLSNSLDLNKEGLYDARISSITRAVHGPGECTCKFNIHFLSVIMSTWIDGSLSNRVLLTDEPETEVSISDIRILQKPAEMIPLQDVLDAHQDGKWIPFSRGCQDATFLAETKLSTAKSRNEARVQSDEILSPSPARVTKNGEKGSNCNSHVDGPEQEALGPHQSPRTPQAVYRMPNSASRGAEDQQLKLSGGYSDRATPQAGRYGDGASPQAGACADGPSQQGLSTKRRCEQAEDRDDGQPNDRVEKVPPPKRGRPRLNKDKVKYALRDSKVEECLQPRLDSKDLSNTHKEKVESSRKKKLVDLEWTDNLNVLSSDHSDSEGEYKPSFNLKNFSTKPYSIRTREKTAAPHKAKRDPPTRVSGSTQLYPSGSDFALKYFSGKVTKCTSQRAGNL